MSDVATLEKPATAQHAVKVRVATVDDLDEIMALCLAAVEDNGFLNASPARIVRAIYPALMQDHGLIGVTVEPDGQLSGGVFLQISQHWYSEDLFLEEKSVFVHSDFRRVRTHGGGRAARLIEFTKKVSDTLGLPLLIGVLSSHRAPAKMKMYQKYFGEAQGGFFLYNGATGAHRSDTEH